MGLAEKKQIRAMEEETIPEFKQKISEAVGTDVEITVDFDSFQTVAQMQEIHHQCLGRVLEGIQAIVKDDLGKEAMQESVKTIVVGNVEDDESKKISLADGTLTVVGNWANFGGGTFTWWDYQEQIEANL